ncbi:hypothetical protein [Natronoglomus mannanivorans]|uniref:Uncharacterized protein n=1 Tax=Natronoglomus mannanivorans TaxID=2979990 RepID=A0AAP2Z364_9EURY|nr:hypothetical protein [Halobacteria archaeon AArc-xg1-1]
MTDSTRDPETMDEPFALLLDDRSSMLLETAFTEYRDADVMELNPDTDEARRARQLHNRLRETHSLGAGATLTVNDEPEAQTVLNTLSHYSVPAERAQQRYVEELTALLFDHSAASMSDIPIVTDFLDDDELRIRPDDLESVEEEPVGRIDVDIAVKTGVDRYARE